MAAPTRLSDGGDSYLLSTASPIVSLATAYIWTREAALSHRHWIGWVADFSYYRNRQRAFSIGLRNRSY
jgi:hypothetical protein